MERSQQIQRDVIAQRKVEDVGRDEEHGTAVIVDSFTHFAANGQLPHK